MPRKARWYRICLMLFLMYALAFVDRNNISMAAPVMVQELHLSATVLGILLSAFFWGYVITQIPGGWFASRFSAKKVIVIGMTLWGLAATLTGFVDSYSALLFLRFLLGLMEGVIWPSMMVLIVHWFPDNERAKAVNFIQSTGVLAPIIMSPLSGWMIAKWDFHMMFILQGAPVLLLAILFAVFVFDSPAKDPYLSKEEREYLIQNKSTNAKDAGSFLEVLKQPKMWLFGLVFFFWIGGMYGYGLWLPSFIKQMTSQGIEAVGWLTAIPYATALVLMYLNAAWSDRRKGKRVLNIVLPLLVAGVSLLIEHFVPTDQLVLNMILLSLTAAGIQSGLGPWWAWVMSFMPRNQSGPAVGFINFFGNFGAIFGPIVVGMIAVDGNLASGFYILGVGLVLDFIVVCLYAWRYGNQLAENKVN